MNSSSNLAPRILIVDDNAAIHGDFRKILGERIGANSHLDDVEKALFGGNETANDQPGFRIDSAYQGQEALDMVKKALQENDPYVLAFVDVRMPPGWDGIETLGHLWKCCPELQAVICTAYSDYSWDDIRRRLAETDSLLILKKPFDTIEALQIAHALTRKWALARQAELRMEDLDRMVRERTQKLREEVEERARVQEALRVSEERFSKAFSFSPMPMAICACADNRFLDANASFFRLTGYPAEQLVNRTINELKLWDIVKPSPEKGSPTDPFVAFETSRLVLSADRPPAAVALEGGVHNQPAVVHGRDGSNRHIVLWTEPIALGAEACLLIIAEDVTEHLKLESQLRQSQKMEAVGCLAAGIAHEFNNLLTVIQGHAGLLGSPGISQSCATESVERITQASQRAASLTRRLLSFSRKQPLQLKQLDLSKAVQGLQKMLGQLLGEHYRLELDCQSELPTTRADEGNIEQVLINLTLNARDAMPGGGSIRIATSNVELDQMTALENLDARPGRFLRLAVSDSGCGMTPEVLRRIFDPFYTTKEIGKGTGLGLSTVQAIVQHHQGWIEVDSRPGHGSTFTIFLPALTDAPPFQPKIETANQTNHYSASGETILVVEDEDSVRGLARLALEQAGYHVIEAADGQEALKVWDRSAGRIDLLLTDMVMPNGLSGNGLAKALVAKDPKLRTVYTTGYSSEAVQEGLSLRNGVNFLPKPYDASALLTAVKACLKHPPAPAHTALPESSLGLVAFCAK